MYLKGIVGTNKRDFESKTLGFLFRWKSMVDRLKQKLAVMVLNDEIQAGLISAYIFPPAFLTLPSLHDLNILLYFLRRIQGY